MKRITLLIGIALLAGLACAEVTTTTTATTSTTIPCYQETTNASNPTDGLCLLNYNGTYNTSGLRYPGNAVDGGWGTSTSGSYLLSTDYKPINATSLVLRVRIDADDMNLSIPDSCFNKTAPTGLDIGGCFVEGCGDYCQMFCLAGHNNAGCDETQYQNCYNECPLCALPETVESRIFACGIDTNSCNNESDNTAGIFCKNATTWQPLYTNNTDVQHVLIETGLWWTIDSTINVNNFSTSQTSVTRDTIVSFYFDCNTAWQITSSSINVSDPAGNTASYSASQYSGNKYVATVSLNSEGTWTYSSASCMDGSSNLASNTSVNLTITVSAPAAVGPGGSTVINNVGQSYYPISFVLEPANIAPGGLDGFMPGRGFSAVFQVRNLETYEIKVDLSTTCPPTSLCAAPLCTLSENDLDILPGGYGEGRITCAAPMNASLGETYTAYLNASACRAEQGKENQCDSRTSTITLEVRHGIGDMIKAAVDEVTKDPLPYVVIIGSIGMVGSVSLYFSFKKARIRRKLTHSR